jgi:hypothetical protein
MSEETYVIPQKQSPGNTALVSLILGIVGILGSLGSCCCCFSLVLAVCSPVAAFLGYRERKDIDAGRSPQAGAGMAQAGFILGLVGTGLLALWVIGMLVYAFVVGFAVIGEALRKGSFR